MKKKTAPDLNTKAGQYIIARSQGATKTAAAIYAGVNPTNIGKFEKTKGVQELTAYYKDVLLSRISLDELAEEHLKNIVQDSDKGAKNKAIEMALDRIEPKDTAHEEREQVMVVLKSTSK